MQLSGTLSRVAIFLHTKAPDGEAEGLKSVVRRAEGILSERRGLGKGIKNCNTMFSAVKSGIITSPACPPFSNHDNST